jgi:peptidoglycan hydrolase-like protein with peptidoglycan-binding domain
LRWKHALLFLSAAVVVSGFVPGAAPAGKTAARKTPSRSTAAKKSTKKAPPKTSARKPASKGKTAARTSSRSSSRKGTARPSRPATQQRPTPERYKEIQQALIDKGYLKSEPTGVWGPESAEALKRFQQDRNLPADGKLSARSLIDLGLGPKRAASTETGRP